MARSVRHLIENVANEQTHKVLFSYSSIKKLMLRHKKKLVQQDIVLAKYTRCVLIMEVSAALCHFMQVLRHFTYSCKQVANTSGWLVGKG